ncbi:MAG: hypothetical protein GQ532_09920 [Methylomarinum sp.]|nr:hypothetical protein [Methylomarinum sp.]
MKNTVQLSAIEIEQVIKLLDKARFFIIFIDTWMKLCGEPKSKDITNDPGAVSLHDEMYLLANQLYSLTLFGKPNKRAEDAARVEANLKLKKAECRDD